MRQRAVLAIGVVLALIFATSASAEVRKAVGSIELTDPAGDVKPISTNKDSVPGLDVVKLSLVSDGKQLKIGATLKDPPGAFATDVVELYFDTDNNSKTGAGLMFFEGLTGFEFRSKLNACAKYTNGGSACSGQVGDTVTAHYAATSLEKYTGATENNPVTVVDSIRFPGRRASAQVPIEGKLVQGTLDYADLGVKPGQTIRILARESCSKNDLSSFFPEIHLTLK